AHPRRRHPLLRRRRAPHGSPHPSPSAPPRTALRAGAAGGARAAPAPSGARFDGRGDAGRLPGPLTRRGPARTRGGALMAAHYIVIEGPIGVGKSSVVERLAERMEARTVMEEWGQNPFLTPFYEGKAGAAFQIELFFLLSRYRQQQELTQRTLFQTVTLSDFVFEKSKLFAFLNLDDSDLLIYEKLYSLLAETVPRPDLVVYLQAPTEILLRRIRTRGRPEEARLSEESLAEVNRAYNHYFFHYTATPLLVVNTAEVDFVSRAEDVDDLLKQIRSMGKGTQYYVPLGRKR